MAALADLIIARIWGNHLHNLLLTSFAAASTLTSYGDGLLHRGIRSVLVIGM